MGRLITTAVCRVCRRLSIGATCLTPLPKPTIVLALGGYELALDGEGLPIWWRLPEGLVAVDQAEGQVLVCYVVRAGLMPMALREPDEAMFELLERAARLV
jgi:hypothetical protein